MRALVVLAVAACGYASPAVGSDAPANADAKPDGHTDGAPSPCVVDDMFAPSATPCSMWTMMFSTSSTVTQNNGLTIAPSGTFADGGCNARNIKVPDHGAAVEVDTLVGSLDSYSALQVYTNTGLDLSLGMTDAALKFGNRNQTSIHAQMPFDHGVMNWWRMRPDRTTSEMVAEYSADASAWSELGRFAIDLTQLNSVAIALIAGTNTQPTTTSTRFVRFLLCN